MGRVAREKWKPSYPHWDPKLPVHWLILEESAFVVFLDSVLDVDWKTKDELKPDPEFAKVRSQIQRLQARDGDRLSDENKLRFRTMLGEAMAHALGGDFAEARLLLDDAEIFVFNRSQEAARVSYFFAGTVVTFLAILTTAVIWACRDGFVKRFGQTVLDLVVCACAGAVGALFSLLAQRAKGLVDPGADRTTHYAEASQRILLGVLGAVLVGLGIRVGVLLPQVDPRLHGFGGLVFVCALAGISERFTFGLMKRAEELHNGGRKEERPALPTGTRRKRKDDPYAA